MPSEPLAFFITFRTFGSWLHGDVRGSVDRKHNRYGEPLLPPNSVRRKLESAQAGGREFVMNADQRAVVDRTIREVCEHRRWGLGVLNVRSNHVHVVVATACAPERAMNAFKSWSTRRLVEAGLLEQNVRPWSRHGSTKWLWTPGDVDAACEYVALDQGESMVKRGSDGKD